MKLTARLIAFTAALALSGTASANFRPLQVPAVPQCTLPERNPCGKVGCGCGCPDQVCRCAVKSPTTFTQTDQARDESRSATVTVCEGGTCRPVPVYYGQAVQTPATYQSVTTYQVVQPAYYSRPSYAVPTYYSPQVYSQPTYQPSYGSVSYGGRCVGGG